MNIKIIGKSRGNYFNNGSCRPAVEYNLHELRECPSLYRELGIPQEALSYFDMNGNFVSGDDIIRTIDLLHSHLGLEESKFFSIIVSPSDKEIPLLGTSIPEQLENGKSYILELMDEYAKSFHRDGINSRHNLAAFAIPHIYKGKKHKKEQLHWHIIVARKDRSNRYKLSPLTNHCETGSGPIRAGFNRIEFDETCERLFDSRFYYSRKTGEKFKVCLAKKKFRNEPSQKAQDEEMEFLRTQLSQAKAIVEYAYHAYEQVKDNPNIFQRDLQIAYNHYYYERARYWECYKSQKDILKGADRLVQELLWISPLIGAAIALLLAIAIAIYQAITEVEKVEINEEIEKSIQAINNLKWERIQAIAEKRSALSTYLEAKTDYQYHKKEWTESLQKARNYLSSNVYWMFEESRIIKIGETFYFQRWSYKNVCWYNKVRFNGRFSIGHTSSGDVRIKVTTPDERTHIIDLWGSVLESSKRTTSPPLPKMKLKL